MSLRVSTARELPRVDVLDSPAWASRCGFVTSPLGRSAALASRIADVQPDGTTTVTVATFNTLRKNYWFGDKEWVPAEAQTWEHRLPLVKAIIRSVDADIIALEEAELVTFEEDFGDFLRDMGYEFVHAEMRTAEDRRHCFTKPTLCFRREMFSLVDVLPRSRAVVAVLEHLPTQRQFFAAACHLQGGGGTGAQTRVNQIMKLLRSTEARVLSYMKQTGATPEQVPFILLGDLNCDPDEPVAALLRGDADALTADALAGSGCESIAEKMQSFKFPLRLVDGLREAVASGAVAERPFTFKWGMSARDERAAAFQSIDYVMFTPGPLHLLALRETTSAEHLEALVAGRAGLPSLTHPSDHLPLAMRLSLRPLPVTSAVAPVEDEVEESSSSEQK